MKGKKLFIICVSIIVLSGLYVSFQRDLSAASSDINFYDKGVRITCETNSQRECNVSIEVEEFISFSDQLALIPITVGSGSIDSLAVKAGGSSDILTDAQWFALQETVPFSRISDLDLSEVKFSTGVMPNNAFPQSLKSKSIISFPKDTRITKEALSGLNDVSRITIPKGSTTIDNDALTGVYYYLRPHEYGHNDLSIQNDISQYHQSIDNARVTQLNLDLSQTNLDGGVAFLQNYDGIRIVIDSGLGLSQKIVDFDALYGSGIGKSKLENISIYNPVKGVRINNAPNVQRLSANADTVLVVKDCGLDIVPGSNYESANFSELDISGNRIDFTSQSNKGFYDKYSTLSFPINNQKPNLYMKVMDDINLTVGDAIPTITPTFKYADGTAIDFTQSPPTWMDSDYFNSYANKVTFSDSQTMSTAYPGTITRTYKNERGEQIGTVKVVVTANAKETPTIALAKVGASSPTIDDELTFTATLTQTGSDDINTDAKIKFMDGATLLSEVVVADGKAEYKTKLSAGQHNITAIYSGNTNFNTVTSTPAIAITVTAPSSGLTAQTIGFTNSTVNMDLGDSVPSNPIVQSDPHGTGAITYESSDTSVATIDSSGAVTVLKAGTTTIKATIAADSTYDSANGSYTLTITAPSSLTTQTLSFDKTTESVCLGDTVNNPLTKDTPASTGAITYESSDETVATVDNTGAVTLLKAGSTTITATIAADSTYDTASASYTLLVSAVGGLTTQTLEFSESSIAITYGERVSNPITQSTPHGTGAITYESRDESIATVDASGTVTVLKAGTTTISAIIATDATYASASDSYELTIAKKPVAVTGLLAKDKVYDGKTKVTFDTENAKPEGILAADVVDLRFMIGKGTYQDANAGVDKAITLTDFSFQGSKVGNYELVLPTITGTITKAELVVNVKDVERKEGLDNPKLTYFITGFVNNETEGSLTGYTKPILETSANKTSPAGTYAITAKNASSDNYTFTYKNGTLSIKAEAVANDKSYSIEGIIGKNGWYTSKVKIKPSGNFTKIYNGRAWVSEITYDEGTYKNLKFKFKQADDTESNEVTIAELKVDTTPPAAQNIKDGDTYFINRAFQAKDDHVVKVRINGKEVNEAQLQVIADASKSYTIELEDEAGNVTSLKVDTKSLDETIKPIEGITIESVAAKDKATIENMLAKVEGLLNDTSYSPTSEQKKQLEETKEKCETLLKELETKNPGNEEVPGNLPINNGVNTGDTNNVLIYGGFAIMAMCIIVTLKRRTQ